MSHLYVSVCLSLCLSLFAIQPRDLYTIDALQRLITLAYDTGQRSRVCVRVCTGPTCAFNSLISTPTLHCSSFRKDLII
jgi:hypothetical protein